MKEGNRDFNLNVWALSINIGHFVFGTYIFEVYPHERIPFRISAIHDIK